MSEQVEMSTFTSLHAGSHSDLLFPLLNVLRLDLAFWLAIYTLLAHLTLHSAVCLRACNCALRPLTRPAFVRPGGEGRI